MTARAKRIKQYMVNRTYDLGHAKRSTEAALEEHKTLTNWFVCKSQ